MTFECLKNLKHGLYFVFTLKVGGEFETDKAGQYGSGMKDLGPKSYSVGLSGPERPRCIVGTRDKE